MGILLKFHPEVSVIEEKLRDPRVSGLLKVRAKTMGEYRNAADFMMPSRPMAILQSAQKNIDSDIAKQTLKDVADLLRSFHDAWRCGEAAAGSINGHERVSWHLRSHLGRGQGAVYRTPGRCRCGQVHHQRCGARSRLKLKGNARQFSEWWQQ